MSVKNKGSWCEKHNQYARTKFDCPHCELDELRERVKKMIDAYRNAENCSCPYCMKDFEAARKAVEELL